MGGQNSDAVRTGVKSKILTAQIPAEKRREFAEAPESRFLTAKAVRNDRLFVYTKE